MADTTERTRHGFTREQLDFLQETFAQRSAQGFDRSTLKWLFGGLFATGLAVSGLLWTEIGSVRGEIGSVRGEIESVRTELRAEIRENRLAITELAKGQAEIAKGLARLEAILQERLPRDR
ncbi:MAG: hypothetical protein F4103_02580 [Boseongicola sp. SB0673_bin_14]|nr:hypothetical protein [Boseongicola sp. SB0673_bin_14]